MSRPIRIQQDIVENEHDFHVSLSDGSALILLRKEILHVPSYKTQSSHEEPDGMWPDGGSRMMPASKPVREWIKRRCRAAYIKTIYCGMCGYEIGCNPECLECQKTKVRF